MIPSIPTTTDDPSGLVGALGGVAGAVLGALIAFGVLDSTQAAALGAVATTALPLVVAFVIRRYAWAPETVSVAVELARRDAAQGITAPSRGVGPLAALRVRQQLAELDEVRV